MRTTSSNSRLRGATRRTSWIALAAALLTLPAVAAAQPFGGSGGPSGGPGGRSRPAFMAELVPPEVVMRNQSELELNEEQKSSIMTAMRETRNALDPIQWQLQEEQEKLTELVRAPSVDEATLLAQAEVVMDLEKELKKSHLVLLVKIKNVLTPEQLQKAKSLGRGRFGRGPGSGGRPGGRGPGGGGPGRP